MSKNIYASILAVGLGVYLGISNSDSPNTIEDLNDTQELNNGYTVKRSKKVIEEKSEGVIKSSTKVVIRKTYKDGEVIPKFDFSDLEDEKVIDMRIADIDSEIESRDLVSLVNSKGSKKEDVEALDHLLRERNALFKQKNKLLMKEAKRFL